jgi:hypothetical protein
MTERLTGEVEPLVFGFSKVSTTLIKLLAIAWAVDAAIAGEESLTEMVMRTVLTSVVAVTLLASSPAVTPSPRASIAGCNTAGVATVFT